LPGGGGGDKDEQKYARAPFNHSVRKLTPTETIVMNVGPYQNKLSGAVVGGENIPEILCGSSISHF